MQDPDEHLLMEKAKVRDAYEERERKKSEKLPHQFGNRQERRRLEAQIKRQFKNKRVVVHA